MSRNLDDLFDYEAARRPELAALVANLDTMTEAEIETARVRALPWTARRFWCGNGIVSEVRLAACTESADRTIGRMPDPVGEMRRWETSETFIRIGNGQLEIHYGQLIWLETSGVVWIDSIRSHVIDPLLLRHTVSCGHVPRTAYMAAVRARARQLIPCETTATPMERVRFYRPGLIHALIETMINSSQSREPQSILLCVSPNRSQEWDAFLRGQRKEHTI